MDETNKFDALGIKPTLLEGMGYMGISTPTPIQVQAIPKVLDNKDLIACAQTGTGKTGAYIIPLLNMLLGYDSEKTSVLIIVPTRELAIQIYEEIEGLAYFTNVRCLSMYGGGKGVYWSDEREALEHGCPIIVTTPGKLISHLNLGYVNFTNLKHVVLDEADRMLDIGFHEDIIKIFNFIPKERQTLLFSATMPQKVALLANKILHNPSEIKLSVSMPAEKVTQEIILAYEGQKNDIVVEKIKAYPNFKSILIFTSQKKKINSILKSLSKHFDNVRGISSNLEQAERENIISKFKSKEIRIVVATDVLSRGIDIKALDLVINYDVPRSAEDYIHRIGRTARVDKDGIAITLVNELDMYTFSKIEKMIKRNLQKQYPSKRIGKGPKWQPVRRKPPNRR